MARHVPAGSWIEETEEDEWFQTGYHRTPYPVENRTPYPVEMLRPGYDYTSSQRRSRSTGRAVPQINVVQNSRYDYDNSPPRSRSRHRHYDEDLVEAVDDVAREIRHTRDRSRDPRDPSPYIAQTQMQMELARERERSRWELEREREKLEYELEHDRQEAKQRAETEAQLIRTRAEIRNLKARLNEDEMEHRRHEDKDKMKRDYEYERLKDETRRRAEEARRKDEREMILLEHEREERDEKERRRLARLEWEKKEKEEEEEKKKIMSELQIAQERKKREEKEKEEAAIAHYKAKQDKEKREREHMLAELKREEEEKARKAKAEKEMWREKLEREKREEEDKKKAKDKEVEEELAKRLHKVGFQQNQVEAILDPKKAGKARAGSIPSNALIIGGSSSKPTYIRISREHIDIETLKFFDLPWDYDHADPNYVVIFQEISKHETDLLFEHTRKLRKTSGILLIEERGRKHGDAKYAFVKRRPSASPSRRKKSPKRVSVNLGLFG